MAILFPFAEYWWFYAAFSGLVALLLALDLSAHRQARPLSMRAATAWTTAWILIGLGFSLAIYALAVSRYGPALARQATFEYLAGYLVEESLSIDNLFVFALLFRYFSLGGQQQHRVLFYGIAGAMIFRAMFVAAGAALIQFHWVVVAFGAFLVLSGVRLAFAGERIVQPERNVVLRVVRRFVPVTAEPRGSRFLVRDAGAIFFTPLMIILLVVETTDILFAIDSVPAVFGVTREPLIAYTSNIFAILGLRAMYFVLAGALDRFHLLKYGLSAVLVFVGLKMSVLDDLAGGRLPIGICLAVVGGTVAASVALSFLFPRAPRVPRPGWGSRSAPVAVGLAFAALGCAALAMALRVVPDFLEIRRLEAFRPEWLFVSGVCYVLCACFLLLRAKRC